MTAPLLTPEVRSRIVADHGLLRGLLGALIAAVRESVRDEKQRHFVRQLLAQFRSEAERHLSYEEAALVPLLRGSEPTAATRIELLSKEHAAQRAMLLALSEDAEDGVREIQELADEIIWFASQFEADMAIEEERILPPESRVQEAASLDG